MLERVMRMHAARPHVLRVKAGRIQCFQLVRPEGGSQPRMTEKRMINIRPSQKLGSETPIIAIIRVKLSMKLYCRTAETTPSVTPSTIANSSAYRESFIVVGKQERISLMTGCLVE